VIPVEDIGITPAREGGRVSILHPSQRRTIIRSSDGKYDERAVRRKQIKKLKIENSNSYVL